VVVVVEFEHVGLYAVSREQVGAVLAACRRADALIVSSKVSIAG
jgi:hypothetical protein